MYEMAKKSRDDMKAKARQLASGDPHERVDSSSWREAEPELGNVQTGPRPISPRQFKRGGKITAMLGKDARHHAGRKPRASGGKAIIDDYMNRDMKEANEERSGSKHIGGMKKGGRATGGMAPKNWSLEAVHGRAAEDKAAWAKESSRRAARVPKLGLKNGGRSGKLLGGPNVGDMTVPQNRFGFQGAKSSLLKNGGAADEKQDKKLVKSMVKPDALKRKAGGRTKKGLGGILPVISPMAALLASGKKDKDATMKRGGKAKCGGGGAYANGGKIGDVDPIRGTYDKEGGRVARASGGKTGKGKTTVNVIIGGGQPAPPPIAPPMMPPRPPAQIAPPPPPPSGGPGMPPGMPPGAPPMPPGMPMGRKSGGRTMEAGAGSGEGRLEKTEMQKRVYP